jgi:hypothetical protein
MELETQFLATISLIVKGFGHWAFGQLGYGHLGFSCSVKFFIEMKIQKKEKSGNSLLMHPWSVF